MKIAIVNTMPVPSGAASVNRFLSYARGLVELKNEVEVLSSAHTDKPEGNVDGIAYHNLGKGKGALHLLGALSKMVSRLWKGRYDAVILVSNSLALIYPIVLVCKLRGIKIIQEKSEFPFVLMKKGFLRQCFAKFYTSTTYKLFDGLIVMTKPLMEYFSTRVSKKCKMVQVPLTIDMERFAIGKERNAQYGDYIAYCGDMAGNKDGVVNLIKAFIMASERIGDVNLLLIGGSSRENDFKKIKDIVKESGNERIIFTGRVSRDEIPALLVNAKALALARPSGLQSTGGFPTKLGEYLSTGNPVVVTAVGDIPLYLNESNSFIVEPNNNEAFAEKLVSIFNDYPAAMEIGKRGKDVANQNFNYKVQAPVIEKLIQELS